MWGDRGKSCFLSQTGEKALGTSGPRLRPVFDFLQGERGGKKQIIYFRAVYTSQGSLTVDWEGAGKLIICLAPTPSRLPSAGPSALESGPQNPASVACCLQDRTALP